MEPVARRERPALQPKIIACSASRIGTLALASIPQARPADRSASSYIAYRLFIQSRRLVRGMFRLFAVFARPSSKPNDPPDKPAGFM
jgi:hypothetical protein